MSGNKECILYINKDREPPLSEIRASISEFDGSTISSHLLTAEKTAKFISETDLDIQDNCLSDEEAETLQKLWADARKNGFTNYSDIVTMSNIDKKPSGKNNARAAVPPLDKTGIIETSCYVSFNGGHSRI